MLQEHTHELVRDGQPCDGYHADTSFDVHRFGGTRSSRTLLSAVKLSERSAPTPPVPTGIPSSHQRPKITRTGWGCFGQTQHNATRQSNVFADEGQTLQRNSIKTTTDTHQKLLEARSRGSCSNITVKGDPVQSMRSNECSKIS